MNNWNLIIYLVLCMIGIFPAKLLFIKIIASVNPTTYKGITVLYFSCVLFLLYIIGVALALLEVL